MEEETIEVVDSEDGGNGLPADITPPSPPPEEVVEPVAEPAPEPEQPQLFKLPDGREVDAATLYREHTENLLPEFTRRSQELAAIKSQLPKDETAQSPLADPEWTPQSYQELIEVAVQTLQERQEAERLAQEQHRKEVEDTVMSQLDTLKKIDPALDENALFVHANKYGFRDLIVAHQNLRDFNAQMKAVQKMTAENIQKRNDPISISPGASGAPRPDRSQFSSATEYLRSLK
jgi:hypothetical protein